MLIGIMGKTGSGKSTITRLLNEQDKFLVIDVDKVNHYLLEQEKLKQEILKRYDVFEDGKINRKKLGMILYNDKTKMDDYNNLSILFVVPDLFLTIYQVNQQTLDLLLDDTLVLMFLLILLT